MKIVYIVKSRLHFYPPCVSQIRMLKKLGYEVEVLYGTCHERTLEILEKEKIKCYKVSNIDEEYFGKVNKLKGWMKFRKDLSKYLKKYNDNDVIYWFGNAETVIPMKGLLKGKKYIVSLLELLDNDKVKRKLLHGILENSIGITCCEETRAYIVKFWYKLKKLPTIFPNKPYEQITEKRARPSSGITKKIIDDIKDEEIVVYQGYLQNTEELLEIAKALKEFKKKYKFVLMGIDQYNSVEKIKEVYNNCVFYPYIPAPMHLEITSYAKIGILFYRPTILNNAYCAPNKIFEYGGFGIPMLGNDIPGLKNTVGANGAGKCIKLEKKYILEALKEIEEKYEEFSKKSREYFESVDNLRTMKEFMEEIIK